MKHIANHHMRYASTGAQCKHDMKHDDSKIADLRGSVLVPLTVEQAQSVLSLFVDARHDPGLSVSDRDLMWEIEQRFLSVGVKVFEDLWE